MLKIRDISIVPPDGWPYRVESTSTTITSFNYQLLYSKIKQHCISNNVSIPTEQEVIDTLCKSLSIPCYEEETREALINKFSLGVPNAPRLGGCCG